MNTRHASKRGAHSTFDRVNYSSLDWPLKTIRLDPDSLEDYNQRTMTPRVSVAELYHENSKLFGGVLDRLAATRLDTDEVRREFLRRRQRSVAGSLRHELVDRRIGPLLTAIRDACPMELFYAVELRVCDGGWLSWHEPLVDACLLVKELTPQQSTQLRSAAVLHEPRGTPASDGPLLVLVGNVARNDLLYGARGYRRTLLEAGRITEVVLHQAVQQEVSVRVSFEFIDRAVDTCLECDGTEESALVMIQIEST